MTTYEPTADTAEHEAFFPSPGSLARYVARLTDFDGARGAPQVTGGPRTVLVVMTDERYLPLKGGRYFSTGNHPVETLVPLMHLLAAGYRVDVATLSGNMAKLEMWAMPADDDAVHATHQQLRPQFAAPRRLADVVATGLGVDCDYAAVFVPGGHGAMIGLPDSEDMGAVLSWALTNDRYVITLCHGPAALLAAVRDGVSPFAGYEVCVFPDALDSGTNLEIGYLPGELEWLVADRLAAHGVTVVNSSITGQVHRDRLLITGDSPLASNALGRLAVETLTGGQYAS